ncbi:MAG: hypothetical protein LDL13_00485 [Calditerrivibrio sp.]|nr:hypothetical protein [Calditerrivibrio sp.]
MDNIWYYNKIIIFVVLINLFFYIFIIMLYKFNRMRRFVETMSAIYKGFDPDNLSGLLKGAIWALVDGTITGVIVATIVRMLE